MENRSKGRPAASVQNTQLVAGFSAHLHGVRAAGTRKKYVHAVSDFSSWAGDSALTELTPLNLEAYRSSFLTTFEASTGREPSRATVRNRLVAIRSFYTYLDRNGLLAAKNPAENIELPTLQQKDIDYLSAAEDLALLTGAADARERIVVWLLRWTGMRVDEARHVLISDIHLTPGGERIVVRVSKSDSGKRTIPIAPELVPQIQQWLSYLQANGRWESKLPLLSTSTGKPMAAQYIWRVVKRVGYGANIRRIECTCGSTTRSFHVSGCAQSSTGENRSDISPHTLRKTFATDAINKHTRLEIISKLLGHASTRVTEKYYAQILGTTIKDEWFEAMGWAA